MAERTPFRIDIKLPDKNMQSVDIAISEDVTPELEEIIKIIPGVETVEILTRYTLFVVTGICFDREEISKTVETAIRDYYKK